MIRVLYVVYWGALEPLGQSLVVPSVMRLADGGVKLTLVTFEKPADRARTDDMAAVRRSLENRGIRWIPLPYHKRPKALAKVLDFLLAWARGLQARQEGPFDIVHARTFAGGLIGLPLARLLRARFIYHNEGFYPDEQVDGGVWQFESIPHRAARWLERRLYASADGIAALSHRAKAVIEALPEVQRKHTPIIVVPSCVDLDRFKTGPRAGRLPSDTLRLVYMGSIGFRYIFDRVAQFVAAAGAARKDVRLRVLTWTAPDAVRAILDGAGLDSSQYTIAHVPHQSVPGELEEQDAGLFFLTQGLSEHGCSPTKIGEYWACGLPVVSTPNVSDADAIIRTERVGVVVEKHSPEEYHRVAEALRELLSDPRTPERCRRAAEEHYSLAAACHRQLELYGAVIATSRKRRQ